MARQSSKRSAPVVDLVPPTQEEHPHASRGGAERSLSVAPDADPTELHEQMLQVSQRCQQLAAQVTALRESKADDAARIRTLESELRCVSQRLSEVDSAASTSRVARKSTPARILRAMRRKTHLFQPQALHDLQPTGGTPGGFACTGHDPQLLLLPANKHLPHGWTRIRFRLDAVREMDVGLHLYFDLGQGFSEATSSRLHSCGTGRRELEFVHYIPPGVLRLRLDPTNGRKGVFVISQITVQEITKHEALCSAALLTLRQAKIDVRRGLWRGHDIVQKLRTGGVAEAIEYLNSRSRHLHNYPAWVDHFATLCDDDRTQIRARIATFDECPRISVLMPVYNTEESHLCRAIESVLGQLYPNWELCIADDGSTRPRVSQILRSYASRDKRIKLNLRAQNGHISAASNTALELATGDFVALLDHDDLLSEHALYLIVEEILRHPKVGLIYSDEDKISADGASIDPYFKPDWNLDLLLSQNYICHLSVYRRSLIDELGGFRVGYEGAQDYDLVLRATERLSPDQIRHVPHVLYHWRATVKSTASGADAKPYAHEAAENALRDHLRRTRTNAELAAAPAPGLHRVRYTLPTPPPTVSLIVPTRDRVHLLKQCIESVLEKTEYPSFEIVVVDNQSRETEALAYLEQLRNRRRVRVLTYNRPFNFSAMNNWAVSACSAEVVGLLNNDLEVINSDWLVEMVAHAMRPGVGAVGAKLYYPNRTIQHGGVILGLGGVAGHAWKHLPAHADGYFSRARVAQEFSAVTAACLLVRRDLFVSVGGLDEKFEVAYNDVDFCLRLRASGHRNIWTPFAELLHHESASRGSDLAPDKIERFTRENDLMRERWGDLLLTDPAYSPNLTLEAEDFSLAYPSRATRPWLNV